MGIIRGGALFILCVLLFFSFLTLNSFYTVSSSLEFNHVEGQLTPLVQNLTSPQGSSLLGNLNVTGVNLTKEIQDNMPVIKAYCANYSDYVFTVQGYTVTLPCTQINQGKNVSANSLLNQTVDSFVQSIYYKNYTCGFWDCFGNNKFPFFLVSQKAHDYWKGKFYLSLIASLIILGLMFFVLQKKLNLPIVTGSVLILASLPLIKLSAILSNFLGYPFIILFNIFFSQAQKVFWISVAIGLFLVAGGIALRVVNSGAVSWFASKVDDAQKKSKEKKTTEALVKNEVKKSLAQDKKANRGKSKGKK